MVQRYVSAYADDLKANIWYSISGWKGSVLIRNDEVMPAYEALIFFAEKLDEVGYLVYQ
jgi:hypothetical protein